MYSVSLTFSFYMQLCSIWPVHYRHTIGLCVKSRTITKHSLARTWIAVQYHRSESCALYFDERFGYLRVFSLFPCLVVWGLQFRNNLFVERCNACPVRVFHNSCSVRALHHDNIVFPRFENLIKVTAQFLFTASYHNHPELQAYFLGIWLTVETDYSLGICTC